MTRALSRAKPLHTAVAGESRSALPLLELLNTVSLACPYCPGPPVVAPGHGGTYLKSMYFSPEFSLALPRSLTDLAIPKLQEITAGSAAASRPLTLLHCPGWRDSYDGRVFLSTSRPSELGGLERETRPSCETCAGCQSRTLGCWNLRCQSLQLEGFPAATRKPKQASYLVPHGPRLCSLPFLRARRGISTGNIPPRSFARTGAPGMPSASRRCRCGVPALPRARPAPSVVLPVVTGGPSHTLHVSQPRNLKFLSPLVEW